MTELFLHLIFFEEFEIGGKYFIKTILALPEVSTVTEAEAYVIKYNNKPLTRYSGNDIDKVYTGEGGYYLDVYDTSTVGATIVISLGTVNKALEIESIDIRVKQPYAGERPTFNFELITEPKVDAKIQEIAGVKAISWLELNDTYSEELTEDDIFKAKSDYSLMVGYVLPDNYKATLNTKETINGKEEMIDTKREPALVSYVFENTPDPVEYSYTILEGDNQKFIENKVNSFSIKIDGDYFLFESFKIGNIEFVKYNDYTVKEGSTIITLTQAGVDKLNTLKPGDYDIVIAYSGLNNPVKGNVVITADETTVNNNNENLDNTKNTNTNAVVEKTSGNPQTGDSIILFVVITIIAIVGLVVTIKLKRNKK